MTPAVFFFRNAVSVSFTLKTLDTFASGNQQGEPLLAHNSSFIDLLKAFIPLSCLLLLPIHCSLLYNLRNHGAFRSKFLSVIRARAEYSCFRFGALLWNLSFLAIGVSIADFCVKVDTMKHTIHHPLISRHRKTTYFYHYLVDDAFLGSATSFRHSDKVFLCSHSPFRSYVHWNRSGRTSIGT